MDGSGRLQIESHGACGACWGKDGWAVHHGRAAQEESTINDVGWGFAQVVVVGWLLHAALPEEHARVASGYVVVNWSQHARFL